MPHVRSIVFLLVGLLPSIAAAGDALQRGRAVLEENCSRCHAVSQEGASPLAAAPPFRTLGERYPIEDLEEALAEGIVTGHPAMPQLSFEPSDVAAIIAYIKSLQKS
jgi:mono/diheme cytochrome c family protein